MIFKTAKELSALLTGVIVGTLLTGGAAHIAGINIEKGEPFFHMFGIGFITGGLAVCLSFLAFFILNSKCHKTTETNKSLTIQEVNHG